MTPLRRAARTAREFLSRKLTPDALKIGVSARLFHPQPDAKGIQSKTLQYLEQSVAHWVMSRDVLVFMVPTVDQDGLIHRSEVRLADYARVLDGLVLQGGADVSPSSYGETPLAPQWAGDRLRDVYEMELVHEFIEAGKPILALDLPSGLDADTGQPLGVAVRAQATATFVAPKRGFSAPGANDYTGEVFVVEIGVPRLLLEPFFER